MTCLGVLLQEQLGHRTLWLTTGGVDEAVTERARKRPVAVPLCDRMKPRDQLQELISVPVLGTHVVSLARSLALFQILPTAQSVRLPAGRSRPVPTHDRPRQPPSPEQRGAKR